jgi:hypothetical protein
MEQRRSKARSYIHDGQAADAEHEIKAEHETTFIDLRYHVLLLKTGGQQGVRADVAALSLSLNSASFVDREE